MIKTQVIHQFVHTLSYGDAISSEVLALRRAFKEMEIESEIYCINVHPRYKGQARDYRDFLKDQGQDFAGTVLLHYSLGSPLNDLYSSLKTARRSLIYHNLTPPHWFEGVNPRIVADIKRGQEELPGLCAMTDLLIADSAYNAGELKELGFNAVVLPLMIDPARWDVPTNQGIASIVRTGAAINVVHIGRFAPNKKIEDIIKIFYFLHHHINRDSRLWLVGIDIDTELYSFSIKRLVEELRLSHAVTFAGCLDDTEIRALYENCTAYICMSEHEGFCLPAIEAMHFGLPVVAYASSALPDTIGGGGVLVTEKRHPEIAELINQIHVDPQIKSVLVARGKERVAELQYDKFKDNVAAVFGTNSSKAANG
jgi:glycosyltransferase involved in cell wall biosynthesis